MRHEQHLVIVGAGPAGIAAAVQASKQGVPHTLLERSSIANTIERYQKGKFVMDEPPRLSLQAELEVGFKAGTREEVLEEWIGAVERAEVNTMVGPEYELVKVEGEQGQFLLTLKDGSTIDATHIILAIGVQGNLREFGVEGDQLPHVAYQLDDPAEHEGKRVFIVGVGDAGLENAMALAAHDNDVAVVNRRDEFDRAKPRNRSLIENAIKAGEIVHYKNSTVDHFEPDTIILKTDDGEERVPADLVIGRLGAIPPRNFLESVGIEFPSADRAAVPEVSASYETNVPGVFVIGALAGYPLIKNCMNQGFEVVEHILGNAPTPADEPFLKEKFAGLDGSVSEILDRIREEIPLFASLTSVQLREFLFDSQVHNLAAGDAVFERNDFTNTFYTILEGEVEVSFPSSSNASSVDLSEEEREQLLADQVVATIGQGRFFGEGGLISGRRRAGTVRAASDCVLIEAPRLAVNKLINSLEDVRRVIDQTFIERTLENLMPTASAEGRAELAAHAEVRTFKPGELLFSEGDEADGLHLIRRGSVAILKKRQGRETVIQYVLAGNYVGEMALLAPDRTRSASVRAKVLTETVLLPREAVIPFLQSHQSIRHEFEMKSQDRLMSEAATADDADRGTVMFLIDKTGAHEATDLLLIDESMCIRCNNCETACAETHRGISRLDREAGPTYQAASGAQLHTPTACQHCENPKCMNDCPPDAIRRHSSGEVYIMDNCIGCGNCASNCPYDVIQMAAVEEYKPRGLLWRILFGDPVRAEHDPNEPHATQATKCDLCRNLPKPRSGRPSAACVASCPTGAITRVNPRNLVDEILQQD